MMRRRPRQSSLFESATATLVADAFDPARLTQARVLGGHTKQELAQILKVSPAAVGQYEAGITRPRADLVDRMSEVLGYPIGFFAAGRPYARLDPSMAHFRSLRSTRVFEREKATSVVEQIWELTFALERRVELPPVVLPQIDTASPEIAARAIRAAWGLPKGPLQHLVRTLEMHGIIVCVLSISNADIARVDAFCTARLPRPVIILTPDRANDVFRHRFTAAHELGHLLLHPDVIPGDPEQEREADRFAAELLTPSVEIELELPKRFRLSALEEISRVWGVSPESLVRRSRELDVITDVSARRAYQRLRDMRTAGLLQQESIDNYAGEVPTLLMSAFNLAEQHGLSINDLASELFWHLPRVRQLLGQPDARPVLSLVPPRSSS
jgi:Zn-dependent peptidase ImmA (M78 family)/transcriptional regulator with XRE-family HTH domain